MATQLTIINSILTRLRESTVATPTESGYSKLIAQFINDAKADMEDAGHNWSAYITQTADTILADGSTTTYDITETNDRSYLLRYGANSRLPMAFDATSGENAQLWDVPYDKLIRDRDLDQDGVAAVDQPTTFAIVADSDGRGWSIELAQPVTSGGTARTWELWWYLPQDDLSTTTDADSSTEILLPRRPLELRALYYALEERGEVMGPRAGVNAWQRSELAVAAAIEIDQQVNKNWVTKVFTNDENI
jgi:hypothetical protein